MMNNQITYIHNKPYKYDDYKFENMVNKVFSSKLNVPLKILSKKALLEEIEKYKYKCNFDKKVFKNEIINPIKLFLKKNKKNNSKKNKKRKKEKNKIKHIKIIINLVFYKYPLVLALASLVLPYFGIRKYGITLY